MRWSNLALDAPPPADALPLVIPGARARTFDSPGFAGMTFYEIQARSIISRVPAASRMPFEYTVNPYRGCSHACRYCVAGDTPVLMADGRTKPLAEIRVGDRVCGTVRRGRYRRYVATTVLAHWQTVKPAHRVTLRDGTELITSGDHRFLTERGWKHVTGTDRGAGRRPHLTTSNKLIGTGAFAEPPKESRDYRLGYLCGVIRGDGTLGTYRYPRRNGRPWTMHTVRLALVDHEALDRTSRYLTELGVHLYRFAFTRDIANRRDADAIRSNRRSDVELISRLVEWPTEPTQDWQRGFLAGIFDAEGHAGQVTRIPNTDHDILDAIEAALDTIGVGYVREAADRDGCRNVRLVGGLAARLRFIHAVGPAIARKCTIAGAALKSDAALEVVSITPLGIDLPMYDITTGTGDFIANGVVSHNCFARNTHTYLDLDAGHDFDTKVVVKVNASQVLRRELSAPQWTGSHIAMGTNVDCYQRAEGRYGLMRGIIAALRDAANPFSILTKGTLITRDIDLLRQAAQVASVGVSFSVGFVDPAVWRSVEPGTPSPRRRLDAVRRFVDAGFDVHVLMAPILPGLTDTDESIDATVAAIAAAGAAGVSPLTLHLRPGARQWYATWLARTHPHLVEQYRSLYGRGSYAPKVYQREISARVAIAARRHGVGQASMSRHRRIDAAPQPGHTDSQVQAEQLRLL
ncbi:MAG TPA: intein-containing Rv2578c family radical SAM protein [Micromonosporaceae bacterium]|jgi:DNA repair photolyase